jgi:DNA-binding NarL/FixJ family response regulator
VGPASVVAISYQPLLLKGLLALLRCQPGLTVAASGLAAEEAPVLVVRHRPCVVILDSGEPDRGIGTAAAILRAQPDAKVIVMAAGEDVDHAVRALDAGAVGYLSSRSGEDELIAALRHVLTGGTYINPTLATAVIGAMRRAAQSRDAERRAALTTREEQIARQLLLGHTNREIAGCLGLREKTVKHYMTILMQKFEARNRLELALCLKRPAVLGAAGVVSAWSRMNVAPGGLADRAPGAARAAA